MERPGATTMRGKELTLIGPELKTGDKAPEFDAIDISLQPVNLEKTAGAVRILRPFMSAGTRIGRTLFVN